MRKICKKSNQNNIVARNPYVKLFHPLRTKALTQKCLSYLGPLISNDLSDAVKRWSNVNNFKYKVKQSFFEKKKIKISMYT